LTIGEESVYRSVAAPQVERVAFLGVVGVPVVHGRDAALDVVQDLWGAQAEVLVAGCPFEAEIAPHGPSPRRESAAKPRRLVTYW
jgi:hypothetical protein